MGTGQSEEDAWRAIVDNYGDRPTLDDPPEAPAPATSPEPFDPSYDEVDAWEEPAERFVPPEPPPAPELPWPKRLAWLGVLGTPIAVLVALVTGMYVPPLLGYALVASFVGGFVYLVLTMQRGGRDPWDDGSRV